MNPKKITLLIIILSSLFIVSCDSNQKIKDTQSTHPEDNYIKTVDRRNLEYYILASEKETSKWNKTLVDAKKFVKKYASLKEIDKIDFITLDKATNNWLKTNTNGNEFIEYDLAILYGELLCQHYEFVWVFDNFEQDNYTVIHKEKLIDANPFDATQEIILHHSKRSFKDRAESIKIITTDNNVYKK